MAEAYFARQPSPKEIEKRIEGYPSWLEIDLDAITHNLEQVRKRVGVEVIPCVKTNAYGHGLVPVVAHMMTRGVKRFLVAKLWEAEQIRDAGLDCGVVCMDPLFSEEHYEEVVKRGITQTVYQRATAERLNKAAGKLGMKACVWIKMDTGLGRVGVRWSEAVELIKYISTLPNIEITGLFSTMSEDAELDRVQVDRMTGVSGELDRLGIKYGERSMASGNAVFHRPFTFLDAVRPGLMLYGFYPDPEDRDSGLSLKQAFSFKARVEQVKWVDAGESLTYSRRFTAPKRMKIGTVHIGYSDGYPRGLTKKGLVRVEGRIKAVLGTVSVNHFLVDLDGADIGVGGVVEAIGREGENDAHKVSELAGIMTYSLMVGMNPLTPRVYYRAGKPVALSEPRLAEK
ncbi:MAG: alanine racemase [Candidatus Bathyarchaeota archaeon]|nr:alanine racemase [Candidatus Bathyarchaeota archaeon]